MDFYSIVDDPPSDNSSNKCLSDVYAMGGKPVTTVNIACFLCLSTEILKETLRGGADKVMEAELYCRGHSVEDDEPKYDFH